MPRGGKREGAGRKPGVDASKLINAAIKSRGHGAMLLWEQAIDIAADKKHPGQLTAITMLLRKISPDLKAIDTTITGDVDGIIHVTITMPDAN